MMDSINALMEILRKGRVFKQEIGEALGTLRNFKLVKIGTKYVRPRDYLDLIPKDIPVEALTYTFKLATRLERGKVLKDPILYAQGVLGLKFMRKCSTIEEMKVVSQIFAQNQLNPILVNELLLIIPSGCSFWEGKTIDERPLKAFFETLRTGKIADESVREVPRIHALYYDRLMSYIKRLQKMYEEILKSEDPRLKDRVALLREEIEKRARTKADKIRALVRACGSIEAVYKMLKNVY